MHAAAISIFLLASAFLLYSLLGYPLLLSVLARIQSRPVRTDTRTRSVSIILPVFNGEQWIAQKLESIAALDYPADLRQVIVVSDGSDDRTEAIASGFEGVEVIRAPKGGKAAALNRGMARAHGDLIFFTDVRQRLHPECLRRLVAGFGDPEVGAVCGELMISDGETREEASVGLYWRIEKWIRRQLSAMGTLLVVTGCLYAIRRELAEPVPPGALGDDIFMPQAVLRKGFRVIFECDARAYDYPTGRRVEFHRKVRTLAGLYQFLARYGLGRHWFHFFSYKVTRLFLPHMLIVVAITSFLLPAPLAAIALGLQALFYGLAACDGFFREGNLLKPVCSTARTFCMLMAAALCAMAVFFVPSSSLWKTTQVKSPKLSG